ncbi:MAG: aminotransferase class V-fold PLP-dependent enzyme [Oscillospiraceae bacterium]|nr:aminotransferase class V-fold PLP-dependent enzyme [Oscillospiraceae bacterium]
MSRSIETLCVHGDGHRFADSRESLSMPIYQTAAFGHPDLGHSPDRFYYTRLTNPTRTHLEETVAALEGAAAAVAFTSGMAAITAVFELFSPGDRILCSADLYGGTVLLFDSIGRKNGLILDLVDSTDPALVENAMTPETKAIYIETPSNPMMNVTDIAACAEIAKKFGAWLIVDNTFLSPYLQNPIALGADIVIHSGTKYLAGHNDTISGFVCIADAALEEKLRKISYTLGATLAPMDAWLTERGIKTLPVRMEHQQKSAMAIAQWLKGHPRVKKVYYVGLPEHPGYAVNAKQSRGAGAMLSFTVESPELAQQVLAKVQIITFAESLGGPESLITFPATQTHADVSPEDREKLGITDCFLRMSVGLENTQDLIADLEQAMA